jgi:hypothetical protein
MSFFASRRSGLPHNYADEDFVSGDSPVILDFKTDMGRTAASMTVVCDGPGDISIAMSYNGTAFASTEWIVRPQETYHIERSFISSLRITHVTDSGYRVSAY